MKSSKQVIVLTVICALILVAITMMLPNISDHSAIISIQILGIIASVFMTYFPSKYYIALHEKEKLNDRAMIALRHTLALDAQMRNTSEFIEKQRHIFTENDDKSYQMLAMLDNIQMFHSAQFNHIQATAKDWEDILKNMKVKEEDYNEKR